MSVSVDVLGPKARKRLVATCARVCVDVLGQEAPGCSVALHSCLIEYLKTQRSHLYKYKYKLPTEWTVLSPDWLDSLTQWLRVLRSICHECVATLDDSKNGACCDWSWCRCIDALTIFCDPWVCNTLYSSLNFYQQNCGIIQIRIIVLFIADKAIHTVSS